MPQITGRARVVGVWGCPVGHSRSPAMQNAALAALGLDWVYAPFEVSPAHVEGAILGLRALSLVGVNVTVPLKELVLPFLDVIDPEAARIGSVNTIHNIAGALHGYSTDGAGFLRSLESLGEPIQGRRILLLGAGGSARALAFALAGQGNEIVISNRTLGRAEALASAVDQISPGSVSVAGWGAPAGEFDLLVNTTTLGMHPREDAMPALPPGVLRPGLCVYDLIYAPLETRLLAEARRAGCRACNGLGMLVWQGALSLALWTGLEVNSLPTDVMRAAVEVSLENR